MIKSVIGTKTTDRRELINTIKSNTTLIIPGRQSRANAAVRLQPSDGGGKFSEEKKASLSSNPRQAEPRCKLGIATLSLDVIKKVLLHPYINFHLGIFGVLGFGTVKIKVGGILPVQTAVPYMLPGFGYTIR